MGDVAKGTKALYCTKYYGEGNNPSLPTQCAGLFAKVKGLAKIASPLKAYKVRLS